MKFPLKRCQLGTIMCSRLEGGDPVFRQSDRSCVSVTKSPPSMNYSEDINFGSFVWHSIIVSAGFSYRSPVPS
jgi:hypothetical protein